MKLKYFYSAVMATVLAVGFTACSSDEDTPEVKPEPKVETALTFDTDTVSVGVGETTTFNVTAGGGDYKAFCENPEIATLTVQGGAITISAVKNGYTGVVITVTGGNGGYEAVSDHEDIAKVHSIVENVITIRGVSNGTAMITVKDKMGLAKTVKVTVTTTDIPFTDEDKAEIMASTEPIMVFDDGRSRQYGSMRIGEEDGKKIAEWNYSDYLYLKCWFTGDFTVGMKADGKVSVKTDYWGESTTYEGVNVEIIKVSDTQVWGLMWLLKDNYLHYGYFILPIDNE